VSGAPLPPLIGTAPAAPEGAAARLDIAGTTVDLRTRGLVAAVVGPPRFGREGEVLAGVTAARAANADLADVSLGPRLLGPAAAARILPVVARADDPDAARAAAAAGAAVVLVPPGIAADVAAARGRAALALVVDEVGEIAAARRRGDELGVPIALDVSRRSGADALAEESAGITAGCRLVRTADVKRTRRVVEVVAALLEARRAR
jgi:hypothetical protein